MCGNVKWIAHLYGDSQADCLPFFPLKCAYTDYRHEVGLFGFSLLCITHAHVNISTTTRVKSWGQILKRCVWPELFFVGDCSLHYQQDPWAHWQRRSSSCSHPNLVPHDYSQFHSQWFFFHSDRRWQPNAKVQMRVLWREGDKARKAEKTYWSLHFINRSAWDAVIYCQLQLGEVFF